MMYYRDQSFRKKSSLGKIFKNLFILTFIIVMIYYLKG